MRIRFIILLSIFSIQGFTQVWQVELGINPLVPFSVESRHHELNQSDNFYTEIKVLRAIKPNWSVGVFAGFEKKQKLAFYQLTFPEPGDVTTPVPQPVQRYFVPMGIITRYQVDNLLNKCGSQKNKWIGYVQAGLYALAGSDVYEEPPPPDDKLYIQIYHPIDLYGNVFPVLTFGLGYKLTDKVYISTEAGVGALYPLHLSLGWRF